MTVYLQYTHTRCPAVALASSTVSHHHPSPFNPIEETRELTLPSTACTDQYGAPPNGWGARYGGISSKSECDSFPQALKAGCNWRFDWYVTFTASCNP
jgi:hypothetical protein